MFKTNPSRTWLTILGMGVGTGAVVTLVGLGMGLQGIILEQIVFGETLLSLTVTGSPGGEVVLDQDTVDDFLAMENVLDVAPVANFPALITYGDLTANIFVEGFEPAYLRYAGISADEGEIFSEETLSDDRNNVILSKDVLKLFGIDPEEEMEEIVGKKVSFRVFVPSKDNPEKNVEVPINKEYTVKGVTGAEGVLNASMLLSELESYVDVTKYEKTSVRVDKSENLNLVQDELVEQGFNVVALSKTVEQATKIFTGIQAVLGVFGSIALIVSAIGMFNTMTVTLLERTAEIGIMRTLGASSLDIKILFLSEAVIVGFLGGVVGILIGMGIGLGLNTLLNFVASRAGGVGVRLFRFPILFLLFIGTFSTVVGFLTGLFPARRAAALNPLDAIRYK
ncbi:MAG: ABC transporter permease [Candidatus Spechtbacterales bacterium]|nr:ABC transporter permease [Candidatus Spechtbacterales bacterium]